MTAQSDREWIRGYARRRAAARLGPVLAAETVTQNAGLGRAWGEHRDRWERRIVGNARVDRMLADTALDNDIAAYQRSRTETMGPISRLRAKSDPYAGFASRSAADEKCTGPDCRICAEGRRRDAARSAGRGRGDREIYR
jgi:hypothetical protein